MSALSQYLECWISVAASLFSQALAGEPLLRDAIPEPLPRSTFGYRATLEGDEQGEFLVLLDVAILDAPLLGEGVEQKSAWEELLREAANSAVGQLQASSGRSCQVTAFVEIAGDYRPTRCFYLVAGERSWSIQVEDRVKLVKKGNAKAAAKTGTAKAQPSAAASRHPAEAVLDSALPAADAAPLPDWMPKPSADQTADQVSDPFSDAFSNPGQDPVSPSASQAAADEFPETAPQPMPGLAPGLELLLDVELEASLRFGAREMPLGEILDLGPGDVIQLDRHISDPVDLIVGDKIVARGEVVLVNGNFGLRVTQVAEPQRRLESIRCLF